MLSHPIIKLLRLTLITLALSATLTSPSAAATEEEVARLYESMRIERLFEIMQEEGVTAAEADGGALPGQAVWRRTVRRIYEPATMAERFRDRFTDLMSDVDAAPLLDFYASSRGQRVVDLELAAREAFLDPDIEAAALAAWVDLEETDSHRHDQLQAFIDGNNLIELNVEGALNSNLAFYRGLEDGGDTPLGEDEMLFQVWSEEDEIRAETTDWVHAYLTLSYQPLPDADFDAYIAMSLSEEGRALNRALFTSFAAVFDEISYELGRATARMMVGEEL